MKKFRKFNGETINDIVEYVKDKLNTNPNLTVSVGCDSSPGNPVIYIVTVMMYDSASKKGAHVVYYREIDYLLPTAIDIYANSFSRLQRESQLALEVAELLHNSLIDSYTRKDLTDFERKKYKFHIEKNNGYYVGVDPRNEDTIIKNLCLTDADKQMEYKFIDIHVDYNSTEGFVDKNGKPKNKSNISYKMWVPYLRSLGYRVFVKPSAIAASSAADILLK